MLAMKKYTRLEVLDELLKQIDRHDFYYQFSDSSNIVSQGLESERSLKQNLKNFSEDEVLPHLKEWQRPLVKQLF
jgi:hypothetical protein